MLPPNIETQKIILQTLASCKKNIRAVILKNSDKKLVQAICECCLNLLIGKIPLTDSQKRELTKYKHFFRKIITKSSLKHKKKILSQQGGFLPYLVPLVFNEAFHQADGGSPT